MIRNVFFGGDIKHEARSLGWFASELIQFWSGVVIEGSGVGGVVTILWLGKDFVTQNLPSNSDFVKIFYCCKMAALLEFIFSAR